jgi:hypothetical protein
VFFFFNIFFSIFCFLFLEQQNSCAHCGKNKGEILIYSRIKPNAIICPECQDYEKRYGVLPVVVKKKNNNESNYVENIAMRSGSIIIFFEIVLYVCLCLQFLKKKSFHKIMQNTESHDSPSPHSLPGKRPQIIKIPFSFVGKIFGRFYAQLSCQ